MSSAPCALAPHPRLYLGSVQLARLGRASRLPVLRQAAAQLDRETSQFVLSPDFSWERNTHNAHLMRAREQQNRVVSLLLQWQRGGDLRFREGAVEHLRAMAAWDCWSWNAWRDGNPAPEATFDLSYGENAATLAVAWDLLHESLTGTERELLLAMARKWVVPSFLKHAAPDSNARWKRDDNSNWLAVCAGGAGLLALAMFEELPEAAAILKIADAGITRFMRSLEQSGGGWTEGVAYWNYGMRYAFMFLLAWETATVAKHPALDLPETLETLRFPLLFAPHGQTCAFGDLGVWPWQPLPVHYAMAERLGADDVLAALDTVPHDGMNETWPNAAELLALHPGRKTRLRHGQTTGPVAKLYPGLCWGVLADRMPSPEFYASVRAGTTSDPHNSADLLSWHCLVNGERLVTSLTNHEYVDTTFGARRFELPEVRADSKNTLLIGGLGMAHPASAAAEMLTVAGRPAIRLDATTAYQRGFIDDQTVRFAGRLFVLLTDSTLLIVDSVELGHANPIETRLHTYATLRVGKNGAHIRGEKAALRVAFGSTVPCTTATARTAPTDPLERSAAVLRWATITRETRAVFATLVAAEGPATVRVLAGPEPDRCRITALVGGCRHELTLALHLKACDAVPASA